MTDSTTRFQDIKDKVKRFVADRDWESAHNPKSLSMSVAIEAAELMEIFQWLSTEDAWDIAQSEEFEHLKEELADVLIYCFSLANQLHIDVAAAISDKMAKNEKRFPAKASTLR